MKILDLRSDTVTRPTPAMKEVMMQAAVGDDVFGEDPAINSLEEYAAGLFGMEKALFCPSGTMTNQIAIRVHVKPGDEVICDKLSHIYHYEGGGIAYNAGASVRLLDGDRGRFIPADVLANINNPEDIHAPISRLLSVENTCNKGGGSIWDFAQLKALATISRDAGLAYHLDGARLFNALVETPENAADYGRIFDSISICLSKGLGAPVGSLLLGDAVFIKKARRVRKVMGGGMRQAGFLAAAAEYALKEHVNRLKDDHGRARAIAKIIGKYNFVQEILPVETNIVIAKMKAELHVPQLLSALKDAGILAVTMGGNTVRFVSHLDFSENDLNCFETQFAEAVKKVS